MKRKRWLFGVLLLIVAASTIWLESQHLLSGWLRGEPFYRGRPTSYWRAEMQRCELVELQYRESDVTYVVPPIGFWERIPYLNRLFPNPPAMPLADADQAARPVLAELVNDPDRTVRHIAGLCLRNLDESDREATFQLTKDGP